MELVLLINIIVPFSIVKVCSILGQQMSAIFIIQKRCLYTTLGAQIVY